MIATVIKTFNRRAENRDITVTVHAKWSYFTLKELFPLENRDRIAVVSEHYTNCPFRKNQYRFSVQLVFRKHYIYTLLIARCLGIVTAPPASVSSMYRVSEGSAHFVPCCISGQR